MTWRALVREPLVPFILLGLGLFGLHAGVAPDPDAALRVDLARVDAARTGMTARLGRVPGSAELADALREALDDDRLVREALRLGLDRDDPIVRRRLIQKLRLAYEAAADTRAPTDAELLAVRDADPDRYTAPARYAVTHVFAARGRHADPTAVARDIVTAIASGVDPARLGDPGPHARVLGLRPLADYAGLFGPEFAHALSTMPEGTWSIVPSQLGAHAVRIDARVPAELLALDAVRARLRADVDNLRREAAVAAALADLRRRDPARLEDLPPDLAAELAEPGL